MSELSQKSESNTENKEEKLTISLEKCPTCGNKNSSNIHFTDEDLLRCEHCDPSVLLLEKDIRALLNKVARKVTEHGGDYANGMRNTRHIVEKWLLNRLYHNTDNANKDSIDNALKTEQNHLGWLFNIDETEITKPGATKEGKKKVANSTNIDYTNLTGSLISPSTGPDYVFVMKTDIE